MTNHDNKTAYAIAFVAIDVFPPVVERIGIYSSPYVTMKLNSYTSFVVLQMSDVDFASAELSIRRHIINHPAYAWCRELIDLPPKL